MLHMKGRYSRKELKGGAFWLMLGALGSTPLAPRRALDLELSKQALDREDGVHVARNKYTVNLNCLLVSQRGKLERKREEGWRKGSFCHGLLLAHPHTHPPICPPGIY